MKRELVARVEGCLYLYSPSFLEEKFSETQKAQRAQREESPGLCPSSSLLLVEAAGFAMYDAWSRFGRRAVWSRDRRSLGVGRGALREAARASLHVDEGKLRAEGPRVPGLLRGDRRLASLQR